MIRTSSAAGVLSASLAASVTAQNVLFAENFDAGIPAGWQHRALGVPIDPWSPGISPATSSPDIWHDWFCMHGGLFRDNMLISPRIDLSGFTRVDFSCVQHQTYPLARATNRVEVSVDGGQSFTVLYDETGTWSGPGTIQFDLDAFAGQPDVRIAFHYQGAVANEWRIDDVAVSTPQPVLTIADLTAGSSATFTLAGATPGALGVIALSLTGSGPLPTPFGNVQLAPPIGTLPLQVLNSSGAAAVPIAIPASVSGIRVFSHAAALRQDGTVVLSNGRAATVQ